MGLGLGKGRVNMLRTDGERAAHHLRTFFGCDVLRALSVRELFARTPTVPQVAHPVPGLHLPLLLLLA